MFKILSTLGAIPFIVGVAIQPALSADDSLADRMLNAIETRGDGPVLGQTSMVATANPLASEAAHAILARGGSAIDAAIAAAMVLSVVEPQSSGIGGGGFLVHLNGVDGTVETYDGRETAPASASPERFLGSHGTPMSWPDAVVGGLSVGVPGLVRMLELAHADHGRLTWASLFTDAITYAETGFPVSPRMAHLIENDAALSTFPGARAYFFSADGSPRRAGDILINRPIAATLRRIAEGGADAFYKGPIARAIVDTVGNAGRLPGDMTLADLAAYKAIKREPVCALYRGRTVCGMGPPSSGGLTTLMMLGLMRPFDLGALDPKSPDALHLIAEAGRIAFADRNAYIADSDFVDVPVEGLIDPAYLDGRSRLIDPERANPGASAGRPDAAALPGGESTAEHGVSTTHLSIVDAAGNAVSLTASVETQFGSRLMAAGMILNNQLTDFSFVPERDGVAVANRVEGGKRPRSSMSPTIVLNGDGSLAGAIGSPGGSRIIGYVAKTLFGLLDWNLDIQAAIDLPHIVNRGGATDIEADRGLDDAAEALRTRGHDVNVRTMTSGLQGVAITPQGLNGGVDKRREGVAIGD